MTRKILILVILLGALVVVAVLAADLERSQPVAAISEEWSISAHADMDSESFVHWDEDEPPIIPARCAKCHSTFGFLDYVGADDSAVRSVDADAPIGTTVYCVACHNPHVEELDEVHFPSGAQVSVPSSSQSCMMCHQGTRAGRDVIEAIAGLEEDVVSEELSFLNVHYALAGATKMGDLADVGFMYSDKVYAGFYEHAENFSYCTDCHEAHQLVIDPDTCSPCHSVVVDYSDLREIREYEDDYDGDGSTTDSIADELDTLHAALYEAIQSYAAEVIGTPIIRADAYPYFFIDSDGDGEVDEGEAIFPNRYVTWTPRLLRTAFNYQYVEEDPGAFAHNPHYVVQLMHDSLEDLSEVVTVDMTGMVRPGRYQD